MKLYEGLKVVEFTTNIAGPTVGQWLAEYGAEVITFCLACVILAR